MMTAEQLDTNLRILERLQMQLSEREQTLRDEKSRLVALESQIEANRRILTENRGAVSEEGTSSHYPIGKRAMEPEGRLNDMLAPNRDTAGKPCHATATLCFGLI